MRQAAWVRQFGVLLVLLASVVSPPRGQAGRIEGRVLDSAGRPLGGTAVMLIALADSVPVTVTETDRLGRFRLETGASGEYRVRAERLGFGPAEQRIRVEPGATASVELRIEELAVALPGVEVAVSRERERFETQAGATTRTLDRAELKLLPGLGEADVLRAVEILPGVVSTSDYTSAFNVRGGSADQNLILLDGIPVYNPFHLGGLFSVFNSDVISRAELMAGGFPAEYGGRVASVLAIESDAGGQGTSVDAGLSLLATRVAAGADVPESWSRRIGLQNGRVRASVRRSYFDVLLTPVFDFPYHLTDLQLFTEAWTAGGARFSLTGYTGRDVLDFAGADSTFPLRLRWGWGNDLIGAGWVQPLAGGRTLEVRAGHTRFSTAIRFPDFDDTQIRGRIGQTLLRADADLFSAARLSVRAGTEANRFRYDNLAVTGGTEFGSGRDAAWLLGAYAQANLRPWRSLLLEAGLRADQWAPGSGPTTFVWQPRLAAKLFFARGDAAVKIAAGRFAQFVHSIRDEELPLGIDVWVLAGDRAPWVTSDQVQLGVEAFLARGWYVSLEGYNRSFDGVVTNNFANDPNDPGDDLLAGTGTSRGVDLLVRRDRGRIRPSFSASWLRAVRDFPDPTQGIEPAPIVRYPPIFDRRLDVEFVLQALVASDVELGLRWNFGSGLPYTRPTAGYRLYDYELSEGGRRSSDEPSDSTGGGVVLGPRNAQRYPAYHRLDVSARRTYRRDWGSFTPYLDVLNVYNRRNPLFYFYEFDASPPRRSGISMFPILPTFGVEVRF
jgi:hypothetical protein